MRARTMRCWESEERYRLLLDSIPDYAIVLLDLEGRTATWNAGAEKMTGYTAEEMIGKPIALLRPEEERDVARLRQQLERVLETGRQEFEEWRMRKDAHATGRTSSARRWSNDREKSPATSP